MTEKDDKQAGDKGGLNWDVFDDLQKKPTSSINRGRTLIGMPALRRAPSGGGNKPGKSTPPPPPPSRRPSSPGVSRNSAPPPIPSSANAPPVPPPALDSVSSRPPGPRRSTPPPAPIEREAAFPERQAPAQDPASTLAASVDLAVLAPRAWPESAPPPRAPAETKRGSTPPPPPSFQKAMEQVWPQSSALKAPSPPPSDPPPSSQDSSDAPAWAQGMPSRAPSVVPRSPTVQPPSQRAPEQRAPWSSSPIPAVKPVEPPADAEADWDDEDEKTTVLDRFTQDAAQALLGLGGPTTLPPPPMSRPPAMIPTPPPSVLPNPTLQAAPAQTAAAAKPSNGRRWLLFVLVFALVAMAAVLGILLWPEKGSLVVTVAGQGNRPLDSVEVLIDGKTVCTSALCRVGDLKAGTHLVQARAAGYPPAAEIAIAINSGQEAVHNITLSAGGKSGIKVSAIGSGLKLYVDGTEIGPLPKELSDVTPGEHDIKVAGSDRYAPYEQHISLQPNQTQTIGPLRLKVVKGLAIIKAGDGADGAAVVLQSGTDQRALPSLPIRLDIPLAPDVDHTLIATKPGYQSFSQPLTFDDGTAEKTFVITLVKESDGKEPPPSAAPTTPAPPPTQIKATAPKAVPRAPSVKTPTPKPAAQTTGSATLNINSIPLSNVILDGRPLGTTPKIGVSVSAGPHTVVFVKDSERKSVAVDAPAGTTKTVSVRF